MIWWSPGFTRVEGNGPSAALFTCPNRDAQPSVINQKLDPAGSAIGISPGSSLGCSFGHIVIPTRGYPWNPA